MKASEEQISAAARRAFEAFCASPAHVYLPPKKLAWDELPDVLKDAWKAAATAALNP
jgi:hypothetical protein